jgi:acetyl esterase/lipase
MADPTAPARRPQLEQAFQHLGGLAATVDLTGVTDPLAQWLKVTRATVAAYGAVGPVVSLEGVRFTPVSANGVAAEWVAAEGADPGRRVVYFHGGGWSAGSPLEYRALSATLARLSRASILMVDYRLAPEHRFPAGLDDCVTALDWAFVNGPEAGKAGADPAQRVSVVGDSAGGNLAAATCVRQAMTGGRLPDRLVLIAGALDNVSMPERLGVDDPICTPDTLAASVAAYLTDPNCVADPLVSPAFAPTALLAKFPPTLIQVSAIEALAYDSRKFAARLEQASVRVNLSLWPDLPHVWHGLLGLFPEATQALGEIADFVNR